MSRNSSPFDDFFKSIKGENNTNDGEFTIGNLLNNKNVQNLLNNEKTKNILMDFASQMTSRAINPTILNEILDSNPNISDELITERINSFKKDHPQSNDLFNKYLQSYQEKRSNKSIYNIRKFVKSDDCKRALDDPQVKQYLKEILNSPDIREKISKFDKK
jgi:uncharacterized Fe-S center protein